MNRRDIDIGIKVILFGASYWGRQAFSYFGEDNVLCFCDNKVRGEEEEELYGKRIVSFQKLSRLADGCIIVVCVDGSCGYNAEIFKQLDEAGMERYIDFNVLMKMKTGADAFLDQTSDENGWYRFLIKYYRFVADRERRSLEYLKRHADITALKPATGMLRERQLRLADFTAEFCTYVEGFGIRPFLNYGNLVGRSDIRDLFPRIIW